MATITLTEDDWFDQFQPIRNPHADLGWNHCLFDTGGAEYAEVLRVHATEPLRVWTLLDDGEGELVIGSGWHYVNRLGYFITTVPAAPETDYEVVDPDANLDHEEEEDA